MIRKLSIFLILFALLVNLSGCHGGTVTAGFTVPEEFDTAKNYEIVFWAKNDSNKIQAETYRKAIKEFEELYPNIDVNLRLYTDYGQIYNDVITNIATDTTPNVCITYPDHIATYITGQNTVVTLNELIDDPKYGLGGSELRFDGPSKEEVVPEFLKECIIGDNYYALPFMRSTEALYINVDYVNKLGYELPDEITWDFVYEVSEKAMEKDENDNFKVNGQKVMIPFIYKSTDNMMIQMLKQLNAGYSTPDGKIEIFNDDTKKIMYDVAEITGKQAFSTFKISSYPGNFLNAGQCIFAIDSTAGATWMGSDAPLLDIHKNQLVEFNTEVRMIPQYDYDNVQMISQGPSVCIFNKEDSGEVLASWLFMQYLLTDNIQIPYSKTEGYVPVTLKAQESDEYKSYIANRGLDNDEFYSVKIDAAKLLLEHVDKTFTAPVFNGSASLRNAAGELIESTVKAIRRKKTVDEDFIEATFKEINALYRLDQTSSSGTRSDLGPLPKESKMLIGCLCVTWILLGVYVGIDYLKSKKK